MLLPAVPVRLERILVRNCLTLEWPMVKLEVILVVVRWSQVVHIVKVNFLVVNHIPISPHISFEHAVRCLLLPGMVDRPVELGACRVETPPMMISVECDIRLPVFLLVGVVSQPVVVLRVTERPGRPIVVMMVSFGLQVIILVIPSDIMGREAPQQGVRVVGYGVDFLGHSVGLPEGVSDGVRVALFDGWLLFLFY